MRRTQSLRSTVNVATRITARMEPPRARRGRMFGRPWAVGLATLLAASTAWCAAPQLTWTCTTASASFAARPPLDATTANPASDELPIVIDVTAKEQTIDGWGGCFNERGWKAMEVLSERERNRLLRSLFDPNAGLKLNICRTPIAASDYATDLYSYDETPGDLTMAHFSIDRDRQRLIPYIKSALALRPDLRVWAVPWSPPSWMKDGGTLTGGHIKSDPATLGALALYFQRYVQAYRAEGIPIYMVMPQNEPCYSTGYTSCEWTGAELATFVRDHLGPTLKKSVPDCQIYLGTFPRSDAKKFDYDYWIAPAAADAATMAYIRGIGCQWGGEKVMRDARDRIPGIKLMQTEAECGDKNTNDWTYAFERFSRLVEYLRSGSEAYMIWNLVLDETGLSTAGWAQCSPIVVNQQTKEITYTPYYFMFEHFSSFVRPGAQRLHVTASGEGTLGEAFVNPDGQVVFVASNRTETEATIWLKINGQMFQAALPARSFNTFTIRPAP